jgi:two-component system, NarL family, nitrate/nitrite response regulator NarL
MFSILIIDDHPLVAGGIATMLKDAGHLHVVGACKTATDALHFLAANTPDIILLDINLPDTDGLTLCGIIRKQNRTSKILGLTSANETGLITKMLKQGANGYLLKNMERSELLHAIDVVMGGKVFLSKDANDKLLEQFNGLQDAMAQVPVVTRREIEVLKLLHEGLSGPQIAEKLFLSPYTIETHRKNLLQKFNVGNTQLLLKAARSFKILE